MMNGITYYKLKSNYEGDITKNCGLTGQEVDNNFYVLEGRDIKSVTVEDNCIVITLMNGETTAEEVAANAQAAYEAKGLEPQKVCLGIRPEQGLEDHQMPA